jgi:hypothetical protein
MWVPVKKLTLQLERFVSVYICTCFGCCCASLGISSIGVCVFGMLVCGCCLGSTFDTAPMEVSREAMQVLS